MTSTDTRIVPVERTSGSLWPSRDIDIFSRDLADIDRHWREMDEWMEKVWTEHPFPSRDLDFFRPSKSFSEAMRRMRDEIDRLWNESGIRTRHLMDWTRDAVPILDKDRSVYVCHIYDSTVCFFADSRLTSMSVDTIPRI
jgi:hypothetical protein